MDEKHIYKGNNLDPSVSSEKSVHKSLQTDTSKQLTSLQEAQINQRHQTQVKTEKTLPSLSFQMPQPIGSWSTRKEDGKETKRGFHLDCY